MRDECCVDPAWLVVNSKDHTNVWLAKPKDEAIISCSECLHRLVIPNRIKGLESSTCVSDPWSLRQLTFLLNKSPIDHRPLFVSLSTTSCMSRGVQPIHGREG